MAGVFCSVVKRRIVYVVLADASTDALIAKARDMHSVGKSSQMTTNV